jgi:hypothetical protein
MRQKLVSLRQIPGTAAVHARFDEAPAGTGLGLALPLDLSCPTDIDPAGTRTMPNKDNMAPRP